MQVWKHLSDFWKSLELPWIHPCKGKKSENQRLLKPCRYIFVTNIATLQVKLVPPQVPVVVQIHSKVMK